MLSIVCVECGQPMHREAEMGHRERTNTIFLPPTWVAAINSSNRCFGIIVRQYVRTVLRAYNLISWAAFPSQCEASQIALIRRAPSPHLLLTRCARGSLAYFVSGGIVCLALAEGKGKRTAKFVLLD